MKQRLLKFRAWAGKKMYYFGLMDLDSGYILGELKLRSSATYMKILIY